MLKKKYRVDICNTSRTEIRKKVYSRRHRFTAELHNNKCCVCGLLGCITDCLFNLYEFKINNQQFIYIPSKECDVIKKDKSS